MIKFLIRFLLTSLMIGWLVTQVDFVALGETFSRSNPGWLVLAGAINLLAVLCATWRWQILLRGLDLMLGFVHLLRIVIVGAFFSMFLPSSVGGDLMKMVLISSDVKRREAAVASVLMDRVVGMAVTLFVGLLAVLLLPSVWENSLVLSALAAVSVVFIISVIAFFSRTLITMVGKFIPRPIWRRVGSLVMRVHDALILLRNRPDVLLGAVAVSFLRQVVICVSVFCVGLAFGVDISLLTYFAVIPISMAITVLPIAINGLGLQDNALILLMGTVGVTAAHALGFSLFLHIMRNCVGLLGGLMFLLIRHRLPQPEAVPPIEEEYDEQASLQPVRQ
jgi:glycosyltransferase 2 family protein